MQRSAISEHMFNDAQLAFASVHKNGVANARHGEARRDVTAPDGVGVQKAKNIGHIAAIQVGNMF